LLRLEQVHERNQRYALNIVHSVKALSAHGRAAPALKLGSHTCPAPAGTGVHVYVLDTGIMSGHTEFDQATADAPRPLGAAAPSRLGGVASSELAAPEGTQSATPSDKPAPGQVPGSAAAQNAADPGALLSGAVTRVSSGFSSYFTSPEDCHGHGTHVAAIIGGRCLCGFEPDTTNGKPGARMSCGTLAVCGVTMGVPGAIAWQFYHCVKAASRTSPTLLQAEHMEWPKM
jgi:subtilisin family serine protease